MYDKKLITNYCDFKLFIIPFTNCINKTYLKCFINI